MTEKALVTVKGMSLQRSLSGTLQTTERGRQRQRQRHREREANACHL